MTLSFFWMNPCQDRVEFILRRLEGGFFDALLRAVRNNAGENPCRDRVENFILRRLDGGLSPIQFIYATIHL